MSTRKNDRTKFKKLRFDPLIKWLWSQFNQIDDTRGSNKSISLVDCLMSGFAMFSLKDPSLLFFNNNRTPREGSLQDVYQINRAPSDTGMRTILDKIAPKFIISIFKGIVNMLRTAGVWKQYEYYQGHLICSIDGVHHFSSEQVSCACCLEYEKKNGQKEYRHYLLSGCIVHPEKKEVMPVIHEPIIKQDGSSKNDCERNAAKRLLPDLRKLFPKEKIVVVEDALGANGPHVKAVQGENFRYIIGIKPDGNKYLFDLMDRMEEQGKIHKHILVKEGIEHHFRYANDLPLNSEHRDIRVNVLDYEQIDPSGKKRAQKFSWITDFNLRKNTVYKIMRMGRSRWKIENETFNTLKNQGYHFEHNYGHGNKYLCVIFALLMMLAFWIDQIQQGWNTLFKTAWKAKQSKAALWESVRSKFSEFSVRSMEMIYLLITGDLKVKSEFYVDDG